MRRFSARPDRLPVGCHGAQMRRRLAIARGLAVDGHGKNPPVVRPSLKERRMPPIPPPPDAGGPAALGTAGNDSLLKRYLLPVGLCDEPRGDIFLAHAVRRRNLDRLRRWMPHYARVHGVLALLLLGLCDTAEASEVSGWLVAAAAVPTAGEVVLAIVFGCVAAVLHLGHD
jgi:hypothetical protein